jgi:uncharacterized membrane protein
VHEPGLLALDGVTVLMMYPALPWFGVMALGYGLGEVFLRPPAERRRTLVALGLASVAAFLLVRGINLYGDPSPWRTQDTALKTVMSFVNASKYPPSLDYALMTLGPALLLLAAFQDAGGRAGRILTTYGRTPLFFYVLHVFLIHLTAMGLGAAMGYAPAIFVGWLPDPSRLAPWGFPLPVAYLVWLAVLAALYPPCRWWSGVKQRRRDWWLSYL